MFQGRLRSVHALQEDAGAGLPDTHGDSGEETYNTSADSWMFYNRMLTTWSLEAFYRNHPKLQIHFVVRKKDYSDKFSFNLNLIYLSSEIKWELMIAL